MCGGFDVVQEASEEEEPRDEDEEEEAKRKKQKKKLPCKPSTVVYGHAASRGLHVKRWSIGVDTGCVSLKSLLHLLPI